jgi:hypothetical protein
MKKTAAIVILRALHKRKGKSDRDLLRAALSDAGYLPATFQVTINRLRNHRLISDIKGGDLKITARGEEYRNAYPDVEGLSS